MHDRAVRTARRLVGDPEVAEDLAAEALARAYARWKTVRDHPNPDAWLLRVVGNLAIDHVRTAGRRAPAPEDARAGAAPTTTPSCAWTWPAPSASSPTVNRKWS